MKMRERCMRKRKENGGKNWLRAMNESYNVILRGSGQKLGQKVCER